MQVGGLSFRRLGTSEVAEALLTSETPANSARSYFRDAVQRMPGSGE